MENRYVIDSFCPIDTQTEKNINFLKNQVGRHTER